MKSGLLLVVMMIVSSVAFTQEAKKIPLAIAIKPIQSKVQAFRGNGKEYIAYELIVSNFSTRAVRIKAINIEGKGIVGCILSNGCRDLKKISSFLKRIEKTKSVYHLTIDGQSLSDIYASISGSKQSPQDPLLQPGEAGILFLFLDFSSYDQIPHLIKNSLDVEAEGESSTFQTISSNSIFVNTSFPIVIHPPVKGGNWWIAGGPSNSSYHRRTILVLNGNVLLPEKFAVDFEMFGTDGLFSGDPYNNRSFYGYGQKIFAVADGTIIRAVDGFPDNIPGSFPPNPNLENVGGNCILLKLDSQHYAFYAHLIPGSLKVKEGDRVYKGQVLGLLGNSGNSIVPHLHFHISNRPFPVSETNFPQPLNSQGVPWILDEFIKEKYIATGINPVDPDVPLFVKPLKGKKIKKEILMDKNFVNFFHE